MPDKKITSFETYACHNFYVHILVLRGKYVRHMNRGVKFLRKLWGCVGERVCQGNKVLSTELIT